MWALHRFFVLWRKYAKDDIDFAATYREPWMDQSIRDFERDLEGSTSALIKTGQTFGSEIISGKSTTATNP